VSSTRAGFNGTNDGDEGGTGVGGAIGGCGAADGVKLTVFDAGLGPAALVARIVTL